MVCKLSSTLTRLRRLRTSKCFRRSWQSNSLEGSAKSSGGRKNGFMSHHPVRAGAPRHCHLCEDADSQVDQL
eukprot:3606546-Prorocentrum_lima.AAC.1